MLRMNFTMHLLKYVENGWNRNYFNKYWTRSTTTSTTTTEQFIRPRLLRSPWSKRLFPWQTDLKQGCLFQGFKFPKFNYFATFMRQNVLIKSSCCTYVVPLHEPTNLLPSYVWTFTSKKQSRFAGYNSLLKKKTFDFPAFSWHEYWEYASDR